MKHGVLLASIGLIVGLSSGCAEDIVRSGSPVIEIAAYDAAAADYVAFEAEAEEYAVDLGDVPVYGSKTATFKIDNPSTFTLRVETIEQVEELMQGETWGEVLWREDDTDLAPKRLPFTVPGGGSRLIDIAYAPTQEGAAVGVFAVNHNASNKRTLQLTVRANGIYLGQPDIEVEYSGIKADIAPPTSGAEVDAYVTLQCADGVCTVPEGNELEFGNVGLDSEATARVTIRNTAQCDPYPGGDSCMTCVLTVDKDEEHNDIGLGFKDGTNTDGRFAFVGSTQTPFSVPQADVDCGNSGEVKVMVSFTAPAEEGEFNTTIVIESNDADEPVIEIPVHANARNAPLAIAEIRECGGLDGNGNTILTDCVYEDEIEPLGRVYFDGSQSYDPSGGTITQYAWEVIEAPQGANPDDYDWAGQTSTVSSFWMPIAGQYTVRLTVWNDSGIQSGVTEQSDITFSAVPSSMLHVQLVWDHPSNDQDLHMTHVSANGNFCSSNLDCFFSNKQPQWFTAHPAGDGPNPRLDKDDTNGLGPENINIDRPAAGAYRVFAHYYPWSSAGAPTVNTVRIYLSGVLRFAEQRTLTDEEQVWAVADITWFDDGTETGYGDVTPYPSPDGSNQVGAIAYRDSSACYSAGGWVFPN